MQGRGVPETIRRTVPENAAPVGRVRASASLMRPRARRPGKAHARAGQARGRASDVPAPLFSPLDAFCRNALAQLPRALDAVMPLSRNHRADLPEAHRDLSAMLTL